MTPFKTRKINRPITAGTGKYSRDHGVRLRGTCSTMTGAGGAEELEIATAEMLSAHRQSHSYSRGRASRV